MSDSIVFEPDLHEYGGREAVLRKIGNPDWDCNEAKHDWRRGIPFDIRIAWNRLSFETRLATFIMAARCEDFG